MLSRSLDQDLILAIDMLSVSVRPGDVLVQCSDGVHALLSDEEMLALLAPARQADAACPPSSTGRKTMAATTISACRSLAWSPSASAAQSPRWCFGR
jgi:serine/threonine protein phosphatase PrpC